MWHSLLGHNGAGKSTLLSVLVGLFDASGGVVEVNGLRLPDDVAAIQQCIGVMPQHDILWEELSPVEHMRVFAAIKGVPHLEVDPDIERILAQVRCILYVFLVIGSCHRCYIVSVM